MKKRYSPEQMASKLREADVQPGKGLEVPAVREQAGIGEHACYLDLQRVCGGLRNENGPMSQTEKRTADCAGYPKDGRSPEEGLILPTHRCSPARDRQHRREPAPHSPSSDGSGRRIRTCDPAEAGLCA